ncbi:MAG: tetratricopeptide repeat protein, partial [Gemmataceae bacterium]|nr:tetratricopeptide repeat protein [Gemmataceae bacterium]
PSNILVESHDGRPVPKVIDFGLAKAAAGLRLTDQTLFTAFGAVLGTPQYMAPEQADFNAVDVDTRADVYALGVILYELLAGSPPLTREALRAAAVGEMLRAIREDDPPPPSSRISGSAEKPSIAAARRTEPARLGRFVKGELDWIVMKALAKDRDRRYETALGFARDVERFLNREPVTAGPPTAAYRARKFVQRNKGRVVAASLVLLALLAGVAGTTWGLVEARRQRDAADAARQAEADRAEGERVAKLDAEDKTIRAVAARDRAERAAEAEAAAKDQAVRERDAKEQQRRYAQAVADFVRDDFFALTSVEGQGRFGGSGLVLTKDTTLRELLDRGADKLRDRADLDPRTEADLCWMVGVNYRGVGEYRRAVEFLERAYRVRRAALGADDPATLGAGHSLGLAYYAAGDHRAAEPLYKRALAGFEKALGADHPDTLQSANNLAALYRATGDYRAAEPLLKRALAGFEKAFGPDHPTTLQSVGNLGELYRATGDYRAAEPLLKRALAGKETALGADHPDTLTSVGNLAVLYRATGDYRAAEPLYKRALAGCEKALGADHPNTLTSLGNLAALYWSQGRLDRSVPLFEDALRRQQRLLGDGHPDTLATSANLGVNYKDAGRVAEGLPLLERAYAARAEYPAKLGWVGAQLANAYARAGRPADAARVVGESLAEGRAKLKPGSPELGGLLAQIGKQLLDLDPAAAEPVLRECLDLREKLAPAAWNTANARSLLGDALLRQGKPAEAEPLLVAGYEGLLADRKNIPPVPQAQVNLPEAADRLVELYVALNKPDEVKKWRAERATYPSVAPPPRPANRP